MPFRFTLQAILRLKESQERQQQILLEQANARVQQCKLQIEALERQRRTIEEETQRGLGNGMTAAEVQFSGLGRSTLAARRKRIEQELSCLQQAREECFQTYHRIHREREVLDTLRCSQLRSYQIEHNRREQRRIDDLFLLRREHIRRG
ncbi:MAG TPA: flagellar export protein FliJ [Terriglobales bacterium]|nr:flagellar export protein FliJ [Terriglobales bacterium]